MEKTNLKVNLTYPYSAAFEYITKLNRINLDKEMEYDISHDRGFIIRAPQSVKKDLKDLDSIYSSRFGATMQDINPYQTIYRCECGQTYSRIEHDTICPKCGTRVKYVGEDFTYYGWLVMDDYYCIHSGLYKSIESLIGEKALTNILITGEAMNEDGKPMERIPTKDEPYKGVGMIGFKEYFDEIIEYYRKKSGKEDTYFDIMRNRDIVFTHSIPVFTTLLRPYNIDGEDFTFEGTNAIYNMMAKLVSIINKSNLKLYRHKKSKDQLLYDLQMKWNELYNEIVSILAGKKGVVRSLFGGRYNFCSRDVIVGNNDLRVDQIILPYKCLIEWLQMPIINILESSNKKGYHYAYDIWYNASIDPEVNNLVYKIILDIIHDYNTNRPYGFSTLLNRNPTISFGGILEMKVVNITPTYTMQIPLQILDPLAADFDGDVLNVLWNINEDFTRLANQIFNPRNSLFISHNDGNFDPGFMHNKDTIINLNTLMRLGRSAYSPENVRAIQQIVGA